MSAPAAAATKSKDAPFSAEVGTRLRVTWEAERITEAIVLLEGGRVLVLSGPIPRAAHVGARVRVRKPELGTSQAPARLAARGESRYLLTLGDGPVRNDRRFPVSLPGYLSTPYAPQALPVEVIDLSASGARVRGLALPVGTEVSLLFTPPGRPAPVQVRCVSVRGMRGATPETGVAFFGGALSFAPPIEE